ncbi:MAG: UDP-glucose--hexose-1-phosphate uridylyltransferase [SAR324 cluster bacterium]|nr:UDP-glucose--hexose-1-phosphate uridylyltransferase [SAR324 cluster bacterium]
MAIDPGLPHRRYNPLTGEWVLVSPHRMKRPWQGRVEEPALEQLPEYDPNCYLCPGNTRAEGKANPEYSGTYVFENDFPALLDLQNGKKEPDDDQKALFRSEKISGISRVICFSPNHAKTLPELELQQITELIETWQEQFQDLGSKYRWVQIFENKGAEMGCSNSHPHGQIWASDRLPTEIEKEDAHQRSYFDEHGKPLLLDVVEEELKKEERIVEKNSSWLAVVPYWAVWPFELLLLPRRNVKRLEEIDEQEKQELAEILKKILSRYDNLFQTSFPYSMGWHVAPYDEKGDHWLLHAHFYPPLLRSARVRKFMVGYEMLAEAQRDLTPEQATKRLSKLSSIHYKHS